MRGSSFIYLVKEGARNLIANPLMSFAGIGVLVACMLLIGGAALFSLNVNQFISYVEDQNEVVIFLDTDIEDEDITYIEKEIEAIGNNTNILFVSGEEGLNEWIVSLGEDGAYLEGLQDEQILPDSFRVMVDDMSMLRDTVDEYEKMQGVDKVSAPYEFADTIVNLQSAVYYFGTAIVGILMVVSVVIIGNTIKITVFNRRKEINIMKMVGATDTFIRMPFFFEGLILGIVSACIAFLLLWGGYGFVINWLGENTITLFGGFNSAFVDFSEVSGTIFTAFVAGGTLIGCGGSLIFVRKHLKV